MVVLKMMLLKAGFQLNDSTEVASGWSMRNRLRCVLPLGYLRQNRLIEKFKWFELFQRSIIPFYACFNLGPPWPNWCIRLSGNRPLYRGCFSFSIHKDLHIFLQNSTRSGCDDSRDRFILYTPSYTKIPSFWPSFNILKLFCFRA